MRGFSFKDAGSALRFCSSGCAQVSLHLDYYPFFDSGTEPEYALNQVE